jgi:outer membrane receptor protein involved in Fe transport
VGDAYGSKVGGELGWRERRGRFFAAYEVRHQGERKDVDLVGSPVGTVLPPFTVMNLRAGTRFATGGKTHVSLMMALMNLTDELYAETSNVSFFRPEPRRQVLTTVRFEF